MRTNDFEMKGYLQEKAINTLNGIVAVVEALNSGKDIIPASIFEEIQSGLRASLFDSTKVVAFLYDSLEELDWSDVDLILETGTTGLGRVLFKLGCRCEPDEMIKERERPNFARRVLLLSKGDRGTSRRAIYHECHEFGRDTLTAQIEILLGGVTQNTKEWSQFQIEIEHFLSPFSDNAYEVSSLS